MVRSKLSEILHGSERDKLSRAWGKTEVAAELAPLPRGEYIAHITEACLSSATTGTPSYKLAFRVSEGEFAGRRFWLDLWLTEAALPMTKRDLLKLGVTSLDQLDNPLPQRIRCKVQLTLRRDDKGAETNRVLRFDVLGIDPEEPNPFAPADEAGATPTSSVAITDGKGNGEANRELFAFGANTKDQGPQREVF